MSHTKLNIFVWQVKQTKAIKKKKDLSLMQVKKMFNPKQDSEWK